MEKLQYEELEVVEEMMSDFEKGFWEGVTIGTTIIGGICWLT